MRHAPQEIRTFFITAVTWQRRALFRAEPMARLLVDTLSRYRDQGRFALHEFVVMPDHSHLLMTPAPDISLEKAGQLIKGGFSFRVKRELGSHVEVWETSFTNHRVKGAEDYERHVTYIRDNPMRARLVESPEHYSYSSASAGSVTDPAPPGLKPSNSQSVDLSGLKPGASTPKRKPATPRNAVFTGLKPGASTPGLEPSSSQSAQDQMQTQEVEI